MVEFRTTPVAKHVTCIDGICHEKMYLVNGKERTVLIDSGSGFGSLLPIVRWLTDKPVTLLLTRGHIDHAMGAGEYEDVWLNKADLEIFREHSEYSFRLSELYLSRERSGAAKSDMIPTADPARFHMLREGDRFDLGGVTLESFACPGHTPGSMVFLDRKNRLLFSGDAFSNATLVLSPEALSVEGCLSSFLAVKDRLGDNFDRVLESHGNGELPGGILDGVIEVCRELLVGKSDRVPVIFRGMTGFLAKKRKPNSLEREDGGTGNIIYREDNLYL